MSWRDGLRERWRAWFGRDEAERAHEDEVRFHLERAIESNLRRGLAAREARRQALLAFGGEDRHAEAVRDGRGARWLDDVVRDVRQALRQLGRQKAYAATALASLALGIGATTAIFSVMSGLMLRPLPFAEPAGLVQLYGTSALVPRGDGVTNHAAYRERSRSLAALAGYEVSGRYLRDGRGVERVMVVRAEREFFNVLGVAAKLGRTFDVLDEPDVVVVGETFWKRRLAGDPSVIGRTVELDGRSFTVVGVMPATFQFPYRAASLLPGVAAHAMTDVWMPLVLQGGGRIRNVIGRLRPGVRPDVANAELDAIVQRLAVEDPERHAGRGVYLVALSDVVLPASTRRVILLLFGAAALVLTLACANVTNLSLVRATLRSREFAVRTALGAGRARVVRQFLTESLLLSVMGGLLALLLAWWGTGRVIHLARGWIPRAHELTVDWRVFAFLLALCTLVALVVGLAPAAFVAGRDVRSALQQAAGRTTMGVGQRRVRDGLVVAEIALAFVLALGSLLLVRELDRLRRTDSGMMTRNVLTLHVGRSGGMAADGQQYNEMAERVSRLPGVESAGFIQLLPLQNWGWTSNSTDFTRADTPPSLPEFPIELRYVTPGYFGALGIALRSGRFFTGADRPAAQPVVIINETLARLYFGNADPVGTVMNRGTIVGVVADVRQTHLDRPASPELYTPITQNFSLLSELGMTLVMRTRERPQSYVAEVRSIIQDADPGQAVFGVRTMEGVVSDSLADFVLYMVLITGFATLALVLAMTGTYGVMSYVSTSRTGEFAIRFAIGAGRSQVMRMVLVQGLRLAAAGIAVGLLATVAIPAVLRELPVSIRPPDLRMVLPVGTIVLFVALAACLLPARKASRVAPISALRDS